MERMRVVPTMPTNDPRRPLFMISVAAELAEMHPQTLRMYERRGLIRPHRSTKHTRLYSMDDVERLRHIQRLTTDMGLNLAGVEQVLAMEDRLAELQRRVEELTREMDVLMSQARDEAERIHRSYRRELIRVTPPGAIVHATLKRTP
jgi:MerR family transcriptional regulator, heat shock protein HspR